LETNTIFDVTIFTKANNLLDRIDLNPDIIVLDYNLDEPYNSTLNGGDVLEEIVRRNKNFNIIMLTSHCDLNEAVNLLKKGARDYITKDDNFLDNLKRSIKTISDFERLKKETSEMKNQIKKLRIRFFSVFTLLVSIIVILYFLTI